MKRLYHWTDPIRVPFILQRGLEPGCLTCTQNRDRKVEIDNNYVYLTLSIDEGLSEYVGEEMVLLAVDMPDEHPVERDLEASVIFEAGNWHDPMERVSMICLLEALGHEIEGFPSYISPEKIKKMIASGPKDRWDEIIGWYRTPLKIPNTPPYRIQRMDLKTK